MLTVGASDNISAKLSCDVSGISRMASPFSQLLSNLLRNSWLNGPAYDKNPVHRHTSPTSLQCITFINSNCAIRSINCICQHKCYDVSKIHYSFWSAYILIMLVFIGQNHFVRIADMDASVDIVYTSNHECCKFDNNIIFSDPKTHNKFCQCYTNL